MKSAVGAYPTAVFLCLVQVCLGRRSVVSATVVQTQAAGVANVAVFLAQLFQFLAVQAVEAEHGILGILGYAQQLINLDMQDIVVAVLRVLDQEHHQERDNGRRGIDDQLPGVVVVEIGSAQAPYQDQCDGCVEGSGAACPAGQGLRDRGEFHYRFLCEEVMNN